MHDIMSMTLTAVFTYVHLVQAYQLWGALVDRWEYIAHMVAIPCTAHAVHRHNM